MRETKDCPYPDCLNCTYDDCIMDGGIQALLKRRRYKANRNITDKNREITGRRFENISHVVMNASIVCL